ncbi:MAG: LON peptidase substrate-binding domain-containing protein [Gammaproteobacteria bacterium]|nr:LON peptidase substrate-binding domain-containing protein [Gammaproteobacteria bacterium]
MTTTVEIPLFPLNTVLFPGGPLPLRIFETRYTDMVRRCMREHSAFGVVLIRAGTEAGDVASTAEIGTTARIVDFYQLPDRLLGITCSGERKFRILERRRQADGLNLGKVEWLPEEAKLEVPGEYAHLAALLRKVLPELGEIYQQVPKHFGDASWVGSRLVEILPISLGDKQACLEMQDPVQRLARVAPLIRRDEP